MHETTITLNFRSTLDLALNLKVFQKKNFSYPFPPLIPMNELFQPSILPGAFSYG